MADFVRVIPAEGRVVRDLEGNRIPEKGATIDRSRGAVYWSRRERDGDVTITEAPAEPAPMAAPSTAPAEE